MGVRSCDQTDPFPSQKHKKHRRPVALSRRLILPGRLRPMTDLNSGVYPMRVNTRLSISNPLVFAPRSLQSSFFRLNTQHCFSCLLPSGIVALRLALWSMRVLLLASFSNVTPVGKSATSQYACLTPLPDPFDGSFPQ